ncbi:hypothetical protein FAIPA1_350029 [Frankia sp. AiPs1]
MSGSPAARNPDTTRPMVGTSSSVPGTACGEDLRLKSFWTSITSNAGWSNADNSATEYSIRSGEGEAEESVDRHATIICGIPSPRPIIGSYVDQKDSSYPEGEATTPTAAPHAGRVNSPPAVAFTAGVGGLAAHRSDVLRVQRRRTGRVATVMILMFVSIERCRLAARFRRAVRMVVRG